jgi:hypothetical protein
MTEEQNSRDLLIITADSVKETGWVSFMFMVAADPERKVSPRMPDKFGFISHNRERKSHGFNVFEGGKGFVVGGGWTPNDDPEWEKRMLDALPSCTLLMDIDVLPWWKELAGRHDVQFRHHHFPGILRTS